MSRTDAISGTDDTCGRQDDDNGRDDDRGKENDMRREEDRRVGEDDIGGEADCMRGRAVDTGGVEHSDASLISVREPMREEFAWPLPEERVKEMMEELRETQVGRGTERWEEVEGVREMLGAVLETPVGRNDEDDWKKWGG